MNVCVSLRHESGVNTISKVARAERSIGSSVGSAVGVETRFVLSHGLAGLMPGAWAWQSLWLSASFDYTNSIMLHMDIEQTMYPPAWQVQLRFLAGLRLLVRPAVTVCCPPHAPAVALPRFFVQGNPGRQLSLSLKCTVCLELTSTRMHFRIGSYHIDSEHLWAVRLAACGYPSSSRGRVACELHTWIRRKGTRLDE